MRAELAHNKKQTNKKKRHTHTSITTRNTNDSTLLALALPHYITISALILIESFHILKTYDRISDDTNCHRNPNSI